MLTAFVMMRRSVKKLRRLRWLLFYIGEALLVECRVWDMMRDLALLKVVAIEGSISESADPVPLFSFLKFEKEIRGLG